MSGGSNTRLSENGAILSVEQAVDAFLGEWVKTTALLHDALEAKNMDLLKNINILQGLSRANSINAAGWEHLNVAAEKLLIREKLAAKLQVSTARKALIDGLDQHIPKALSRGVLSEHAVIAKAVVALRATPRDDGRYVLPVVFAPLAATTDFSMGPARLVAKPIFEAELAEAWARHEAAKRDSGFALGLANDWRQHSIDFDHYITVDMVGFEDKMAWPAALDTAQMMLNVMRMYFGFHTMDDVRIGNGFIWQSKRSSMRITTKGEIWLSSSFGGSGSHLESGWDVKFGDDLAAFAPLLGSSVAWPTQYDGTPNPMYERLIYSNRLIAEAYSEPHEPIRLVRLISALEALSLIGSGDKAHNLAHRCAAAGGWSDPHVYCVIYDAVRDAYRWRNAVVHGDAPRESVVHGAFRAIERHLLDIYLGMLSLLAGIANLVKPRSVARLRREFAERIDMFFWAPSLVT